MNKFEKKDRLLKEQDFRSLLTRAHQGGRRDERILKLSHFKIYRDINGSPMRVGFTIPKKVLKTAVDRNRVKRVLREFFRMNKIAIRGNLLVKLEKSPTRFDYQTLTEPLSRLLEGAS